MKYKVTLKDGIELLVTADKEVNAVRLAKDIKDRLLDVVDEAPSDFEMGDLKKAYSDAKGLVSAIEAAMSDRRNIRSVLTYLFRLKKAFHDE